MRTFQSASHGSKVSYMFSGDRKDFTPWFMAFSAYVAWKLVKSATIADGTRSRPAVPERILARADPRPADIPAVQRDVDGNITNQSLLKGTLTGTH